MKSGSNTRAHYDASALRRHYEDIRGSAVSGLVHGPRHALAVLLRDGMAAWLDICAQCSVAVRREPEQEQESNGAQNFVDSLGSEVIDLLANMAFNRLREMNA